MSFAISMRLIAIKMMPLLVHYRYKFYKTRFYLLLFALFTLIGIFVLTVLRTGGGTQIYLHKHTIEKLTNLRLEESVLLDKGVECQIPELDPFAKEIMRFDKFVPKIFCLAKDWVQCYKSECSVKNNILQSMEHITCTYKDIIHINDQSYTIGDPVKISGTEVYRLNASDHVKVSCTGTPNTSNMLSKLVPPRWYGVKSGFRPVHIKKPSLTVEEEYDIMVLGFDSASRNGFMRRLPKTYDFLTKVLKAVILKGFNVVGDGTVAALFALLTGKTELELPDARKDSENSSYLDPNDFVFRAMEENGYRTAYLEDMPWIGTFQYRFKGFKEQPADHYLRSMLLEESGHGKKWWKGQTERYCMGDMPQYAWMLGLTKQFFELSGKHFCFTFIADISHDDFNLISTAEDDLIAFLKDFKASGKLKNTLLVVLGDHGCRYSKIRKTYEGRMEERMPFLAVVLPDKLKKSRPEVVEALEANSDVLTTPFDVYATLLEVAGLRHRWNPHKVRKSDLRRSLSLLEKIPKNRTCGDAGVLPHWCACARWHQMYNDDMINDRVVNSLVSFINDMTLLVRNVCEERKLLSTVWVMRYGQNDEIFKYTGNLDTGALLGRFAKERLVKPLKEYFQAKIIMSPGNAVYEGTVTFHTKENYFHVDSSDISRVNWFGNESQCIITKLPHLDKYCFCKDNIQ